MKNRSSYQVICVLSAIILLFNPGVIQAKNNKANKPVHLQAEQPSLDIQPDALAAFPYKRTRKIDPFKKEQSKELFRATAQLGLGVGLIGGIYYLIGGSKPLDPSLIMAPLIANMLSEPLGNIGSKLCLLFIPAFAKPSIRKAMDFKKQYNRQKAKFEPSMQTFLENAIQRYFILVDKYNFTDKYTEKAIEELLAFPAVPKPIDPPIAPITQFLQSYPTDVRLAVGDFVVQAINDSKVQKLNKKAVPLMFVGPPGTGKSYLASQLGDLLDLPVQIIDLSTYKNVSGNSFRSDDPDMGIIVDVLLGAQQQNINFSNKILVLDEVDKVLAKDKNGVFLHKSGADISSLLHSLLETQETKARLTRYEGATHDISQLKIILVGNHTFSEVLGADAANALETRVNLIKFTEGFSTQQKTDIAQEHVKKHCQQTGLADDQVDLTIIDSIIKKDTQMGHKGVRILLKVIDAYLRTIEQGERIGQIAGLPPVKFDVEKAYQKQQP